MCDMLREHRGDVRAEHRLTNWGAWLWEGMEIIGIRIGGVTEKWEFPRSAGSRKGKKNFLSIVS